MSLKERYRILMEHIDPLIAASYKRHGVSPKEEYRHAYSPKQAKLLIQRAFPSYVVTAVFHDPVIKGGKMVEEIGVEATEFNQKIADLWYEEVKNITDSRERCAALNNRLNGFLSLQEIDPTAFDKQLERGLDVEELVQCCTDKCGLPILEIEPEYGTLSEEIEKKPASVDDIEE